MGVFDSFGVTICEAARMEGVNVVLVLWLSHRNTGWGRSPC